MLFKRISYRIALQFTGFVFVLLLINGLVFLAADFSNARFQTQSRLTRTLQLVIEQSQIGMPTLPERLSPILRDRVRIADADGNILYSGGFFEEIPFKQRDGIESINIDHEQYSILTAPITTTGQKIGTIQVLDVERFQGGDLPMKALIYLVVSIAISAVTFFVGLYFARRSLKPAEQMMERLEQFTQDASHELRTPLTAVSTSLDLALATNDYRDNILTAKKDLKDVVVLIERLLELARLDTFNLQRENIDFASLVADAIEKHQQAASEKHVTIDAKLAPNVRVSGDPTLLRQVVNNLLGNAIKFNVPNGHINVTLTSKMLTVHDTGKGIASDALPRIFDRFFQEESSRSKPSEGIGLGLALVKRILDLHGWSIAVESTQGKGATFRLKFAK